jgi:UrcA family protein
VIEDEGRIEMLSRFVRITAAVLSGVTASLFVTAVAAPAAVQDKPVVVYAEPENVRTERVSYRDLDLAVASDQKALHRRVGSAVRRVCEMDDHDLGAVDPMYRACALESWADARPQIARAIARAEQLALNGQPSITAGAIAIASR